jgi:ATP phosphoribosyltransferase regulatory subunit
VSAVKDPLREVEAAIRIARARGVAAVAVDLGEARGLGYYDELLARFGRPGPAIGFAVDLEFATQALERTAGPVRGRARARAARRGRGRSTRR